MILGSGKTGENAAAKYLKKNGYTILERNYRKTYGEIDIIVKRGDNIAFVEVKTRKSVSFGTPAEFVTKSKQKKIIKTAYSYIQKYNLDAEFTFDIIEVYIDGLRVKNLNHIIGAFYI